MKLVETYQKMFSTQNYKFSKNLETKQIVIHKEFSSLNQKMDFYLKTGAGAYFSLFSYDLNIKKNIVLNIVL